MNDVASILKSLIPVKMELELGGITGGAGALAAYLFGEWNQALEALAVFILIDYLTGVMAAYIRPGAEISSEKGLRGIIKKLSLVTFVAFGHWLDYAMGQNVFCQIITFSMLGNEGISIIENLSICGVPVPDAIRNKLEKLAQEKKERDGTDESIR